MEYPVKQLYPAHADHISYYKDEYLDNMFKNEFVVGQKKYDGERMLIHIDHGNIYCTSRRISKKTGRYMENQDRLPYLVDAISERFKNWDYTVLDCECYLNDWSTIAGILHSLPERAKELQKDEQAKFAVFDCLWFRGKDITEEPYNARLAMAVITVQFANYDNMTIVHSRNLCLSKEDWQQWMKEAIDEGFEGIVLKSLNRKYYDKAAILKCKQFETVDVVVIDYKPGTGKYSGLIGALKVGYYDPDKGFVIISNVNCSTDAERAAWTDNFEEWKYSVIEVKCQEITDRSLRHPRYVRKRDDKDYTMVTRNTIFKA